MKEGVDFDLVPVEGGGRQAWDVRLNTGDYPETVIRYGNIAFDGDNGCLNFNFVIESTPDGDLTEENVDLQKHVGDVLEAILSDAVEDGSLQYGDEVENRY
jgi:hypothetical protein